MGSLQKFVERYSNCEDIGLAAFPVEEVHKITVLDMRLENAKIHGGNILVYKQGDQSSIHLIPIDHGYCLLENMSSLNFITVSTHSILVRNEVTINIYYKVYLCGDFVFLQKRVYSFK